MSELTWLFSDDRGMGTRAVALGFDGYGQGLEVSVEAEFQADDADLAPSGYEYTSDLADILPTLQQGTIVVQFVGSASVTLDPDDITMSFGGVELTVVAALVQETERDVVQAIGYAFLGATADLPSADLEIAITGVSNPNVVSGTVNAYFVEGLADAAPATYASGVVDTFDAEISLDPEPSGQLYDFIFTGAVQARLGASLSTLTLSADGYVQAVSQLNASGQSQQVGYFFRNSSYNCACGVDEGAETLAEMRPKVLALTGYAAQAANPPPGIANLYNLYLDTSQKYLYSKYKALQTERFFSWQLQPGVRYYGLWDNTNNCEVKLNRYRVTGAWIQDLNNVWWPLIDGIDPTFYTLDQNFGWPNYYEIRQCIEVFPAPQAAYTLWIKGHFDLLPFSDDEDVTTINAEPVKNYAIFLAKAAKGAQDAGVYERLAMDQIGELISGAHGTKRYIPGTAEIPVPTPPVMVHFES